MRISDGCKQLLLIKKPVIKPAETVDKIEVCHSEESNEVRRRGYLYNFYKIPNYEIASSPFSGLALYKLLNS